MRKRLLVPGLTLALLIFGPIAAMPPSAVADVVIVAPEVDAKHAGPVNTERARPWYAAPKRRLFGVWLITMSGTVVVLRARRRRTF